MDRFYWGAFVVLPTEDGLQTSQTIVSWEQKDDITIHSHNKVPFNWINSLRTHIQDFVKNCTELQGTMGKVPISCWVANSINPWRIVLDLRHKKFKQIIWGRTKRKLWELDKAIWLRSINPVRDVTEQWLARDALFFALSDLFKKAPKSWRVSLDMRAYGSADEMDDLWLGKDLRLFIWSHMLGIDLLNDVYWELSDVLAWMKEPSTELKTKIRELAFRYVDITRNQLSIWQSDKGFINRFISIDNEDDIRNMIFVLPELRELFCSTFISELWFSHNICIKPHWAKPSPPFGDVAATFVADMIDRQNGSSPSSASINFGEEYT